MKLLIFVICVLILGSGAFFGFIRKLNRSLVRLFTLVICAVSAYLVANYIGEYIGNQLLSYVRDTLQSSPQFVEYVEKNPAFEESLAAVCQMLAGPLLFMLLYMVFKLVSMVLYWLICLIFRVKGPGLCGFGRLLGAGVGLACGAIGLLVFATPLCGYTAVMENTMNAIGLQNSQNQTVMQMYTVCSVKDTPLAAGAYYYAGDAVFNGLTTVSVGGESTNLQAEVTNVADLMQNVLVLGQESAENYGDSEIQAVEHIATDIEASPLLATVGSGALASVSEAWLQNKPFIGIARPSLGGEMDSIFNGFLQVFATSNAENIGQDLHTFAKIFGLLVKHEMFSLISGTSENAIANKLAQQEVINEFYAVLEQNPRMAPVKTAIGNAGMRILLQQLGSPDELRETHGVFLSQMATVMQGALDETGMMDSEMVKSELTNVLQEHNIEVPEAAVQMVSDVLVEEFADEELASLSNDEVVDRLIEHFKELDLSKIDLGDIPLDDLPIEGLPEDIPSLEGLPIS